MNAKDKLRPGQMVKLKSVEELLGVTNEESSMDIDISLIHTFKDHPFKVLDDAKMDELVESIKVNGVLSPVLLRPAEHGTYELISGHRRTHAAELAGLTAVPAIIRDLSDDEATIVMVDSNIQREELLPSEKAFAFKMKMDAMRRQGTRSDLTSDQNGPKLTSWSIGEESGISGSQVKRYIRLTELIPELLEMVDNKRLQFTVAVDISYIDKDIQKWILQYIHDNGVIKAEQVSALRSELESRTVNQQQMIMILNENLKGRLPSRKFSMNDKQLKKFFPEHFSDEDIQEVIYGLLVDWKYEYEENNNGI